MKLGPRLLALLQAILRDLRAVGSPGPVDRFYAGVDNGEPCSALYAHRNELDPKDPRLVKMNETLRTIGCFTSRSERTDR